MKFLVAFFIVFSILRASEPCLTNIRQVTFTSMGFEKAGEAYFSSDEKHIIFQAVPIGKTQYQMYVMNLNEGIPKMVSTGEGACTCGFFRPDGKKILFSSSHEDVQRKKNTRLSSDRYSWDLTPYMNIYEANLDGTCLTKLTHGPAYHAEASYSPDGKSILYASNEDGSMNLYIMDANGENKRQITFNSECYNGGPFFSPNGKEIVFRADRDRKDYLQIYLIDVQGNNERQITNNDGINWAPFWYPDGKILAYTSSVNEHGQYEIYLINIETKKTYQLTDHLLFNGLPVFNNDGTKLMWTSKRGEDERCHIFIADFLIPTQEF